MSDLAVEFDARPNRRKPRHRLPGFTMTALVAIMTVICFVTEVKAACQAEGSALLAASRYLSETGTICGTRYLSAQQTAACAQYDKAMEETKKCTDREVPKEEEAKRAAKAAAAAANAARAKKVDEWQAATLQATHDFTETVKIGMTAAQVDAADKEAFYPTGWGRKVNTTVTANGTTEQWVYRFSSFRGAHDLYLYFQNGVLAAIQN